MKRLALCIVEDDSVIIHEELMAPWPHTPETCFPHDDVEKIESMLGTEAVTSVLQSLVGELIRSDGELLLLALKKLYFREGGKG
jgi:hypothetical protein